MKNVIRTAITAVGGYVPDYILTNQELEQLVDTSDEWIRERTGIRERRILKGSGLGTSFMAKAAIAEIIAKKGIDPLEIDLLICCTVTPDMLFPATANIIANEIGAKNAWGFDLEAACSGFLYGLSVGSQFIETGRYKKVVIVGADKMSAIINYQDRNTCIIFGDGAGAVLLEPTTADNDYGIHDFALFSDGEGMKYLHMKAGGSVKPASVETVLNQEHYVYQEGKQVFKNAIEGMSSAATLILERNQIDSSSINYLVPHQANQRIINATAQRLGIDEDKIMFNITRYGNTTNGTIPLCLWDWEKDLKPGDNLLLACFGGGFTWGSMYLTWAYEGAKFMAHNHSPRKSLNSSIITM